MYYISVDFLNFWQGDSFNFLPLCLSLVGLAAAACGLLALSVWLNKKGNTKKVKDKGTYWE